MWIPRWFLHRGSLSPTRANVFAQRSALLAVVRLLATNSSPAERKKLHSFALSMKLAPFALAKFVGSDCIYRLCIGDKYILVYMSILMCICMYPPKHICKYLRHATS